LTLFSIFKYITYATLAATGTYYTYYELIAVPYMYPEGVSLTEVFKAYPVTIDIWVWMIWLGVFELETSFIPEEKLKGALKWGLSSVRVSCYLLGFSALYGFFANLQIVYGFEPYSILDVCSLSGSGFSLMVDIPEFEPVNSENCLALANAELYRLSGHDIIVDHETLVYSEQMAWSIVINGVAWWMVMAVLEGEYWLEQTERMTLGLSALYGFFANLQIVYGFEPYSILDLCSLSGTGFSLMVDIPEFVPLDAESCLTVASAELYRLPGYDIIVDYATLVYSEQMAWSVIINGIAWWMVIAVLEVEYRLEQKGRLVGVAALTTDLVKGIVYSTLFATAVYWWYVSGWIDFIDSMVWIAAFILMDMNILGLDTDEDGIPIGCTAA